MTTVQQLIERIRREYLPGRNEKINRLTASINSSDTNLSVDFPDANLSAGARLSIGIEDMRVWSFASGIANVLRGAEGSTAASHTAGDVVHVNPQWTDFQIFRAINDTIRGLEGDGIYGIDTAETDFSPAVVAYELPLGTQGVYQVLARLPGPEKEWIPLRGWAFGLKQNSTDFTTAISLTFTRETPWPGQPFRVLYRYPLTQVTAVTDIVGDQEGREIELILALGAAWRLTSGEERTRNLQAPNSARYEEVPAGALMGVSRELRRQYQIEVNNEKARIARLYPTTRR